MKDEDGQRKRGTRQQQPSSGHNIKEMLVPLSPSTSSLEDAMMEETFYHTFSLVSLSHFPLCITRKYINIPNMMKKEVWSHICDVSAPPFSTFSSYLVTFTQKST